MKRAIRWVLIPLCICMAIAACIRFFTPPAFCVEEFLQQSQVEVRGFRTVAFGPVNDAKTAQECAVAYWYQEDYGYAAEESLAAVYERDHSWEVFYDPEATAWLVAQYPALPDGALYRGPHSRSILINQEDGKLAALQILWQ